jgi:hypothetical protein
MTSPTAGRLDSSDATFAEVMARLGHSTPGASRIGAKSAFPFRDGHDRMDVHQVGILPIVNVDMGGLEAPLT